MQQALERTFKRNIIAAMETGNRQEVNLILKHFKTPQGQANYTALFSIPKEERLPAMAKQDIKRTTAVIVVGLTGAMESMNLSRPMNSSQIFDLADAIIETSEEDNLSLEDLLLFMQKLTRGEYGVLYESMDIPKFMEKFEIYREERFQAIKNIREEQAANHRPDYSDERTSDKMNHLQMKDHLQAAGDFYNKKTG